MAVTWLVKHARSLHENAWEVELSPKEVRMLGRPSNEFGSYSIIVLQERPKLGFSNSLSFEPSRAVVVNLGKTSQAFVFADPNANPAFSSPNVRTIFKSELDSSVPNERQGDLAFVASLPASLRTLGQQLLNGVRATFQGSLRYHASSKRFVESPNNFWAVVVQPRDRSLVIIVRGSPESYQGRFPFEFKIGRSASYSRFKIRNTAEIPDAVRIIQEAATR